MFPYYIRHTITVHLEDDDLYFELYFHSWTAGGGGGFSYTRTHVSETGDEPTLFIESGLIEPENLVTSQDTSSYGSDGVYLKIVEIESNDQENPLDSIYVLNMVGPQANIVSNHFNSVDTTENVFYYVVESASIDGNQLETGDEVALFDGDLCVGFCCWLAVQVHPTPWIGTKLW